MEATVTSPGLHLRARADQHARIKYALNHGDKLTLIGVPDQYKWQCVRVQRTGDYGYIYSPYIRTMTAPKTVSAETPKPPPAFNLQPDFPTPLPPEASIVHPEPAPVDVDRSASWDTMIVPTIIIVAVIVCLFWTLFAR